MQMLLEEKGEGLAAGAGSYRVSATGCGIKMTRDIRLKTQSKDVGLNLEAAFLEPPHNGHFLGFTLILPS